MPQVYCPICGAPILEDGTFTNSSDIHKEWLNKAVLLTTAHQIEDGSIALDEYYPQLGGSGLLSDDPPGPGHYHLGFQPPAEASRRVIRLEAYTKDGNTNFHIPSTGENVTVFDVKYVRGRIPVLSRGGPLYIPMHQACMQLCDRFIASIKASTNQDCSPLDNGITSIKSLWEVLCRRVPGNLSSSNTFQIDEPHCYYGGRLSRSKDWKGDFENDESTMLEINPIMAPDLTDVILKNLESLRSSLSENITEPETSSITPSEESRSEPEPYHNLQDLDLDCDSIHSQAWWCGLLVNRKVFPWLWDLDDDEICSKQRKDPEAWNWELLVRKLSQLNIHEPSNDYLKLPLALRNRRRIWRILSEARLDDLHHQAIERWKNGGRQKMAEMRAQLRAMGPPTLCKHGRPIMRGFRHGKPSLPGTECDCTLEEDSPPAKRLKTDDMRDKMAPDLKASSEETLLESLPIVQDKTHSKTD